MQNSGKSTENQSQFSADWGDIDSFCRKYGFYSDQTNQEDEQRLSLFASNEQIQHSKEMNRANFIDINSNRNHQVTQKLSTEQILRLAGERFTQVSSQKLSMLTHPCGSFDSDLSVEDKHDVELAQLLLTAAEQVENQQLEGAMRLLENCQWISSNVGTPVQRLVFYFSEALRERINDERGSLNNKPGQIDACVKRNDNALLAMHRGLPFGQVLHFTAAQTILENINNGTRVHLVDFSILTGMRWAALMQAEEVVAVLFPFVLKTLISKPICLENLMNITQKIKPSIIFVTEIEANLNSPSFFTRFTDSLFYYGAFFDSLEESMAGDDKNRMVVEAGTFRKGIRNIIEYNGRSFSKSSSNFFAEQQ